MGGIFFRWLLSAAVISVSVAQAVTLPGLGFIPPLAPAKYPLLSGALSSHDYCIKYSGYFRTDYMFDTRQMSGSRENLTILFPQFPLYDAQHQDINDYGIAHMLSIQTRNRVEVSGPCVGSRELYGLLEFDFTGPSVIDSSSGNQVLSHCVINGLAVRHACITLKNECSSLLIGQYWHPLYPPESAGNFTVTLVASPFEPTSRNPQIRLSYRAGEIVELSVAAVDQVDFKNNGPFGFSSKYLRNAILPNLNAHIRLYAHSYVYGISADFKRLIPRPFTQPFVNGPRFKTQEGVNGVSAIAYVAHEGEKVNWIAKGTYAENLTDHLMICGYGVTDVDPVTGREKYTPTRAVAGIFDCFYKGKIEPGFTLGFTKNIGAKKPLIKIEKPPFFVGNNSFIIFGRGSPNTASDGTTIVPGIITASPNEHNTIEYVAGALARIRWNIKPITVATELYFSRAVYATLNEYGEPHLHPKQPVNNMRFTFALFYYF